MDAATLSPSNVYPTTLWRNRYELRGQTVSITYDPAQQWWYLDRQTTEEVTMIKIWDSKGEVAAKSECFVFRTGARQFALYIPLHTEIAPRAGADEA
jgi:hypothetical protein